MLRNVYICIYFTTLSTRYQRTSSRASQESIQAGNWHHVYYNSIRLQIICTCVCQRFARLLHLLVCDLLLCMVLLLLYSTACAEAVLSTYRLLAVLAEQCAIQPVAGAAAKAHSALHNHDLVRY
jgi:hypothetical protein